MGAVTSKCSDDLFNDERYLTLETKYNLIETSNMKNVFPLRVNIYSSHGGLLQDIAYQDIDVYFAKETKMLLAVSEDGRPRVIPLNAALKCSVIDDYDEDIDKCLKGRTYIGLEELLVSNPLPKVVYSEQGYYYRDYSHTVEREDVLIVKELTNKNGQPTLKCYEANSNEVRWLEKPIDSTFTTESSAVTMNPASLFDQVKLPVKVLIKTINNEESSNGAVDGNIYTITNYITRRSVIASIRYAGASLSDKDLFEVYLDVPLEVEIIKLTKLEMHKLRVAAQEVFSDFNSSKPRRIVMNPSDKIQSLLLHNIIAGSETGIHLLPPEPSYTNNFPEFLIRQLEPGTPKARRTSIKQQGSMRGMLSGKLRVLDSSLKECHSEKLVRKNSSVNYGKLLSGVWTPKTLGCSTNDISTIKDEEEDYVEMDDVVKEDRKLSLANQSNHSVNSVTIPKGQAGTIPSFPINDNNSQLQRNVAIENSRLLKQFSVKQVVSILRKLHLSEYSKIFEKEAITGSLLLDLDESILTELGMAKKLHRLKILRVIDGRESIEELVNSTAKQQETLL